MSRTFFFTLSFFLVSSLAFGDCNFKTGEFIKKLYNPESIDLIEIKIPKSGKYAQNFLKIISTGKGNINPKLRKRFNSTVKIHFEFGSCEYSSKVRQHGDYMDHVDFADGGYPIRSLDVKLENGNILGAVRFKLLLPETRLGVNEILASLILRKAGFIAPETFEVDTIVNGGKSLMLFQEVSRKEMLERNMRREFPIFEGDESLIWSHKDFSNFELEDLSLSRMVNGNWFKKSTSSQKISLLAYSRLQRSYLSYSTAKHFGREGLSTYPNNDKSNIFNNYFFSLLAMNGGHALAPHNRKYYFNALTDEFEPIYYDGNVRFGRLLRNYSLDRDLNKLIEMAFKNPPDQNFLLKLRETLSNPQLETDFISRIKRSENNARSFFKRSVKSYYENTQHILALIKPVTNSFQDRLSFAHQLDNFENFQKLKDIKQIIISDAKLYGDRYLLTTRLGNTILVSIEDIRELISNNMLKGERAVFLSNQKMSFERNIKTINKLDFFPGKVSSSIGMITDILPHKKTIIFKQTYASDWVLLSFAKLQGWKIKFEGIKGKFHKSDPIERFNALGLTGCVTIYKSIFENSTIDARNGQCEDTINLIDTTGNIENVNIYNSYSDGLDIDFSNIEISNVQISKSHNDCIDLSSGSYILKVAFLKDCADKGISIGEKSYFKGEAINVKNANIGISTKDSSVSEIHKTVFRGTNICSEVKQKKQEFGGAVLIIKNHECLGPNIFDLNSLFLGNNS